MGFAALIFEGLVGALALGAAVLCWRVDRRLAALRSGQDGVGAAVKVLDHAVERAQASLAALKGAAEGSGRDLEAKVREARRLADELQLLTESAEARAERLARPRRREPPADRPPLDESVFPAARHDPLKTLR